MEVGGKKAPAARLLVVDYTADTKGPSQTVGRYAIGVELLCGWHGSLLQPHAVYMMARGVNKQIEMQEYTLMSMHHPPCLSLDLFCLLCFDTQS